MSKAKARGIEMTFQVTVGWNSTEENPNNDKFKVRQAIYDALIKEMPVRMMPVFLRLEP